MQNHWLDTTNYTVGLELQEAAVNRVQAGEEPLIYGLEHEPVITLGKRGEVAEDLKLSEEKLSQTEYRLIQTDRGGQATLHNPGQLVLYPILDLKSLGLSVRDYLCLLEKSTIEFLSLFGLEAHGTEKEPGLFVEGRKVAFFGVRIQKGVTSHGVSINIDNDLEAFRWIRNCGMNEVEVTSVFQETKRFVSLERAFHQWSEIFSRRLNMVKKPTVRKK